MITDELIYFKTIQRECIIAKYQWISWITSTQASTNKRHPPIFFPKKYLNGSGRITEMTQKMAPGEDFRQLAELSHP